jgi:hypothetical protein
LGTIGIINIAGHRHRDQCRRLRHSDILHISPILEHSGTGLGPLIPMPDCSQHWHFKSFRYRTDRMPDTSTLLMTKLDTHCTSIQQAEESDTPCTIHICTAGGGEGFTLASTRKGLLMDTPCKSSLQVMDRDTPCTFTVIAVE